MAGLWLYRGITPRFRQRLPTSCVTQPIVHSHTGNAILVANSFARLLFSLPLVELIDSRLRPFSSLSYLFYRSFDCVFRRKLENKVIDHLKNDEYSDCFNFPIFHLLYLVRNLFLFTCTRYFCSSLRSLLHNIFHMRIFIKLLM